MTIGEAEAGRGFLRTGDGTLTLDVWAWNAEKDGTSMDGFAFGLERANVDEDWEAYDDAVAGSIDAPSGLKWRRLSMVSDAA